jgi:acetyl-CoA C-acetyltransferase
MAAGVAGEQVDYVIMGHVLQVDVGQITAWHAAVLGPGSAVTHRRP